jgi:Aldehyde dehydrogenase family
MPAFARTAGFPGFRRLIYRAWLELKMRRVWISDDIAGGLELPIGGCKQSGVGSETRIYDIEEWTRIKSTHIELGECPRQVVRGWALRRTSWLITSS